MRQVDLLVNAKELVDALAEAGDFSDMSDALKRVRTHKSMLAAVSTLLGVAEGRL